MTIGEVNNIENLNSITDLSQCPVILTVDDLADLMRIGRNKAYSLVKSGELKVHHLGKSIRIYRDDVIDYLKK